MIQTLLYMHREYIPRDAWSKSRGRGDSLLSNIPGVTLVLNDTFILYSRVLGKNRFPSFCGIVRWRRKKKLGWKDIKNSSFFWSCFDEKFVCSTIVYDTRKAITFSECLYFPPN